MRATPLFFLLLSLAQGAGNRGDVFASIGTRTTTGIIRRYSPAGVLLETWSTGAPGFVAGSAFDAAGNFHVASLSSGRVYTFDKDGNLLREFLTGDRTPESIVFNCAGEMYVGHGRGDHTVRKFAPAGTLLSIYHPSVGPFGADWIDLAADQSTLFYTSEGRLIRRFDLRTERQLPDFAALPGTAQAFAIRLLSDGGLIVADQLDIKRLDAAGKVIKTYDAAGQDFWFSLSLDPDGTSIWASDFVTGMIYRFNLASAAVEFSIDTGFPNQLRGVSALGEVRQGCPSAKQSGDAVGRRPQGN